MALYVIIAIVAHLVQYTGCEPVVSFPINSQLPPVARVDEPFSYEFSPYTFESSSDISYSLGDAPTWLSIDSKTRRLYGTPEDSDVSAGHVVGQPVEIVADDGGGTTSLNATLVISRNPAPSVKVPISEQIGEFGAYSAPASLLSYPSAEFAYTFDSDTFDHTSPNINYYATSNNSSPLPAWIKFDSKSLTFSGQTPPFESLIQPPQTFDFKLVASDVVGFSATSVSFSLVVGSHKLTTKTPSIQLSATRGKQFTYSGLRGAVMIDGKSPRSGDVDVSSYDMPNWLSLDTKTWKLEGTPGNSDRSTNFTLKFADKYSDVLDVIVTVNVATGLFRSTFDNVDAKAGTNFELDLKEHFWDPSDVEVTMETDPREDWLSLDDFKLNGRVPKMAEGALKVSVTAFSKSSDISETEVLNVKILATAAIFSTLTASTTTSEAPTSTISAKPEKSSIPADESTSKPRGPSRTSILLAILIPLLTLMLVLFLLAFCFIRRRKSRRTYLSPDFRNKISGPVLDSLRVNGKDPEMNQVIEVDDAVYMGRHGHQYERRDFGDFTLQVPSSPSLRSLRTPALPPGFLADDERYRSSSLAATEEGRRSWVTVEGTATATATATARRSESSLESQQSDTTLPELAQNLIPPPAFLPESGGSSFRSGLDLAIPSLEDLPTMQGEGAWRRAQLRQTGTSSGFYSPSQGSSFAFSSSRLSSPRLLSSSYAIRPRDVNQGIPSLERRSQPHPSVGEQFAREPEVGRRCTAQPRAHQWLDLPLTHSSFSESIASVTDPSFGSEENWRLFGAETSSRPQANSVSYLDIVDDAPFHPSQPSTGRDGAQPGERDSDELMLPQTLADGQTSARASSSALGRSASRISQFSGELLGRAGSRMSRLGQAAWRSDDSEKESGSSYKVFI